jgi:hypothetical protein
VLIELDLLGPAQTRVGEEGNLGILALRRLEDRLGRQPLVNVDRRCLDEDLFALLLLAGPNELGRTMRIKAERVTRDRGDVLPRERRRRVVQAPGVLVPVVANLPTACRDSRLLSRLRPNLPPREDWSSSEG